MSIFHDYILLQSEYKTIKQFFRLFDAKEKQEIHFVSLQITKMSVLLKNTRLKHQLLKLVKNSLKNIKSYSTKSTAKIYQTNEQHFWLQCNVSRRKFYQDGYVVIEDFLQPNEVAELLEAGKELLNSMPEQKDRVIFSTTDSESAQNKNKYFLESGDKIRYFFEAGAVGPDGSLLVDKNVSVNKIGHALHVHHPIFKKYTLDERVKETCWQLGMADPAIAQSMYIYKSPGTGGEVTPHQDATYLYTEPLNIVGFWIALEDATIENGCLWIAKGSHKSGVHRRYIRNPDNSSDELLVYTASAPFYQKNNFQAVQVPKGTCILLHGQVVHYSDANKSTNSRNAYTFHIIEQRNTKYSEENWLQPTKDQPFTCLYNKND